MPIIGDGESRALTNRANAQTECLAAPSLKRAGRAETSRNQLAAQIQNRCMSARAKALSSALVRANELGANRRLRKSFLAIIFCYDLPPKLVTYGSPERCHRAGAFRCSHVVVFGAGSREAMRSASHAIISERDQALRPLMAVGSPILKDFGN